MRLIGGHTPTDGSVQICINERFVSVCDENWNNSHAAVVCRQLGHNGSKLCIVLIQHAKTSWSLYTASLATHKYGSSQTVINSDILCNGSEKKLADCFLPGVGSGSTKITHGTCDSKSTAGVICSASE